ncbi:hypothetical protein ABKN59_001440 [Abortiporus biennis]
MLYHFLFVSVPPNIAVQREGGLDQQILNLQDGMKPAFLFLDTHVVRVDEVVLAGIFPRAHNGCIRKLRSISPF